MLKEDNEAINCSIRNEILRAIFMDLVQNETSGAIKDTVGTS